MRQPMILAALLVVSACASTPPTASDSWSRSAEEIHRLAQAGQLTPVQEQQRLRDAFVRIHGPEPQAMRFFAYSISLLESAQNGAMPLSQARALVTAREEELIADHEAAMQARHRAGYDYQTN